MITPFDKHFKIESYEITPTIIQRGYIELQFIPDLSTVLVMLDEANDLLSSAYMIIKVTEENLLLYPTADINEYVLTWFNQYGSSSSSSSSEQELELKILLESGIYTEIQIRYISTN